MATSYNTAKLGNTVGGATGGWLGMIAAEVLPVFANSVKADRAKRPGVVTVKAIIQKQGGGNAVLTAIAASDREAGPKDLVRATYERLVSFIRTAGVGK